MLTKKNILLLLTFVISCNGFFWQSNQVPQQQQTVQPQNDYYKQVPLSYFRTYTYQPLTYPPAPAQYTPVQAYPVTTRLYPNNMPVNNWQRQSQPVQNGMPLSQPMQAQSMAPQPMPQPQQQPPQPMQSQLQQLAQNEFLPQQMQQSQQLKPSPPAPPMYGGQSDSYNYQYVPPVTPMNVQHVQFVPCMCPVTVTVSSSADMIPADKRADELVTSESNDSISILSVDDKTNNNLNNL